MSIAILDYGSQYSQLIARRVRELEVYCELFPWDTPQEEVLAIKPQAFILSGGPASVYAEQAPFLPTYLVESNLPILGICYGMQLLAHTLGGKVASSSQHEYGSAHINLLKENGLVDKSVHKVWMSHGDRVEACPPGFEIYANSPTCPIAVMGDTSRNYYGLQFHPEVAHTPNGDAVLRNFLFNICGCRTTWTAQSIIEDAVLRVKKQVGDQRVLSAVSGGVDSTVATALVHKAIGNQLEAVFVDTGLLRENERSGVEAALRPMLGENLHIVDAGDIFLTALADVTDPEKKRRIIGETSVSYTHLRAHET